MSRDFDEVLDHHGSVNMYLYFAEHWCADCPRYIECGGMMEDCYWFGKWHEDVCRMKGKLREVKNEQKSLFDIDWES